MTDLSTIAFAVATSFVVFSTPEVLSKLGFIWDEFKVSGAVGAMTLGVKLVIQCLKCVSFWTALVITGSFTLAGLLAFAMYVINRHN